MTVDNHSQNEKTVHRSVFQNLTLIFAGLTFFFAAFSIITGNRLSTLLSDHLNTLKENNSQETAAIDKMRTALDTANTNLEAAKQAAAAEKKNSEKLNQKLSTTQKELEKVKADLAAATQAISEFKSTHSTNSTPSIDTANPELPVKQALPQGEPPALQNAPPASNQPSMPTQPE